MLRRFLPLFLILIAVGNFAHAQGYQAYERVFFGSGWQDSDKDCLNTRHEILQKLSTNTPSLNPKGCRVIHGQWHDSFSDKTFSEASALDIDHLVPLKWAWTHGADKWTRAQRLQFANDLRFIFPVEKGLNRSKGAKPPMEWLPPNVSYHCQYVVRFYRAVLVYDFELSLQERDNLLRLKGNVCAKPTGGTT